MRLDRLHDKRCVVVQISISWPDWISAICTGGALISTLYLVRRDRREAATSLLRAQAEQVTCWFVANSAGANIANCIGHVMNRSDEPVFDVQVSGARSAGLDWTAPVVAPSSEENFVVHAVSGWTDTAARIGCIEFTDARGTRWRRSGADLSLVDNG